MEPYFLKIKDNLISKSCKNIIIQLALENQDRFKAYKMKNGHYDGNNFFRLEEYLDTELISLKKQCSLEFYYMIIMHKPYHKVIKHRDGPFGRNCVLSIPLLPTFNYPPTNFYDINEAFVGQCDFVEFNPAFLNTQQIHDLINQENMRLNLQLCFDKPFEEVVNLYKNKKLFSLTKTCNS